MDFTILSDYITWIHTALEAVRNFLLKIFEFLPIPPTLALHLMMFTLGCFLAYHYLKKLVMNPLKEIPYFIILAVLIYLILVGL